MWYERLRKSNGTGRIHIREKKFPKPRFSGWGNKVRVRGFLPTDNSILWFHCTGTNPDRAAMGSSKVREIGSQIKLNRRFSHWICLTLIQVSFSRINRQAVFSQANVSLAHEYHSPHRRYRRSGSRSFNAVSSALKEIRIWKKKSDIKLYHSLWLWLSI